MIGLHRLALAARPDRKGHGLLLMAAVWALIGLGIPGTPTLIDSAWHQRIPELLAAGMWVATAGFAVGAAWWVRARPLAIGLLILMPGIRMASYVTSWAAFLVDGGSPGYSRGWLLAAQQVLMIAFVFYVASDQGRDTTVDDLAHVLKSTEGDR